MNAQTDYGYDPELLAYAAQEAAYVASVTMAGWAQAVENAKKGRWLRDDPELGKVFLLGDEISGHFVMGKSPGGDLFIGATHDLGIWWFDVPWKRVIVQSHHVLFYTQINRIPFSIAFRGHGPVLRAVSELQPPPHSVQLQDIEIVYDAKARDFNTLRSRSVPMVIKG